MTKRIFSGLFILTAVGALGIIIAGALTEGDQLIVRFLTAVVVAALGLYVVSDLRLQSSEQENMAHTTVKPLALSQSNAVPVNSTAAFMATVNSSTNSADYAFESADVALEERAVVESSDGLEQRSDTSIEGEKEEIAEQADPIEITLTENLEIDLREESETAVFESLAPEGELVEMGSFASSTSSAFGRIGDLTSSVDTATPGTGNSGYNDWPLGSSTSEHEAIQIPPTKKEKEEEVELLASLEAELDHLEPMVEEDSSESFVKLVSSEAEEVIDDITAENEVIEFSPRLAVTSKVQEPWVSEDSSMEEQGSNLPEVPFASVIDLRKAQSVEVKSNVDTAIKAGEKKVVSTLVEQGMLSTDGEITDRDVRTMVYVAFTSNELRKLIRAGGNPNEPNPDIDLGAVELFDETVYAAPPKRLYSASEGVVSE